jgi:hypothetical protein
MKYLMTLLIVSLSFIGCKEKTYKEESHDSILSNKTNVENETTNVIEVDPCISCDSIYRDFPKDPATFESLYGYPNGPRYDGHEDISKLFECLGRCYNDQMLTSVVKLQSNLKYNADATSHLRHNTSIFFMNHIDKTKKILSELSCSEFSKFIYFSFDRISMRNQFYEDYCYFLLNLQLEESCKYTVLNNYCVFKNVETDEH